MSKGQSLQDPFLNALRKDRIPVSIFLVNGIKLQGQIESFDQYVVLLKNTVSQMVYKHAISTVVPTRNPRTDGTTPSTPYPAGQGVMTSSSYQASSPSYPSGLGTQGSFDRSGFNGTRQIGGFTRTPNTGFERQGGFDRSYTQGGINSGFDHRSGGFDRASYEERGFDGKNFEKFENRSFDSKGFDHSAFDIKDFDNKFGGDDKDSN